jgi:hypothetical protein
LPEKEDEYQTTKKKEEVVGPEEDEEEGDEEEHVKEQEGVKVELLDRDLWHKFRERDSSH